MHNVWVAAVHMLTEVREEVDFMRDGSISAEHHTGLQAYRSCLPQTPETTEKVFSKVQCEEFRKMNGKKHLKSITFTNKLRFLRILYHWLAKVGSEVSSNQQAFFILMYVEFMMILIHI